MAVLWFDVVDALVTALATRSGFRRPESDVAGVTVLRLLEGDTVNDPDAVVGDYVIVGYLGDPDARTSPGTLAQVSGPLSSARPRDETGSVVVRVVAWAGADEQDRDVYAEAGRVLGELEAVLRDAPQLGLVPARAPWFVAELADAAFAIERASGPVCVIETTVTYRARRT